MMKQSITTLNNWRTAEAGLKSSYRRMVIARLPVNLYSAQARMQRRAATLLHGMDEGSSLWEELDCIHLADDERGDRTSLHLGGATGGVALTNLSCRGLLAAAGNGTLFLQNADKLSHSAQRVLVRIFETGRYTPVGDPFPRPIACRIILSSQFPMAELARRVAVRRDFAEVFGQISLPAEKLVEVLGREDLYRIHPSSLAAAS